VPLGPRDPRRFWMMPSGKRRNLEDAVAHLQPVIVSGVELVLLRLTQARCGFIESARAGTTEGTVDEPRQDAERG